MSDATERGTSEEHERTISAVSDATERGTSEEHERTISAVSDATERGTSEEHERTISAVSRHRYVFRCHWFVPAAPATVFATLERLHEYPAWWPQVRRTNPIDDQTCELEVRSALPFALRLTAHHARRDADAGVLEARLTGDLVGSSRWTLAPTPDGAGTVLRFGEEVEVHRPLLRALSFARPAFRANHAVMMWAGQRGLRSYLATGAASEPAT